MLYILAILDTLLEKHITWSYLIRNYFKHNDTEHYSAVLIVNDSHRLVVNDTPYPEYVEVWTDAHPGEDGVRIKKSSLLEYIIFILKEDFNI